MIVEHAPAKINLALHVRRRRPDGYHELETLFAFAREGDVLSMEPAGAWRLTIAGPEGGALEAPGDFAASDNLVARAALAFAAAFPGTGPQAITLDKRLPVASGIGGGSADAAAMLRALARMRGVANDDPVLRMIAARLGADVPACLLGRTALGTGVGEALCPVEGMAGTPLLLVNPRVPVSTASVFRGWNGVDRGPIGSGGLLERATAGRNDLAAPARAIAPVIGEVEAMLDAAPGVLLARMSGSGATCFGLFRETAAVEAAADAARGRGWWTLVTTLGA